METVNDEADRLATRYQAGDYSLVMGELMRMSRWRLVAVAALMVQRMDDASRRRFTGQLCLNADMGAGVDNTKGAA